MKIADAELRIDTIRQLDGPCSVRITHLPTDTTVQVDDAATMREAREQAMAELQALLADK